MAMYNTKLNYNGEPCTWRHVSTVRGQALGNLPQKCGKAPSAEPTPEYAKTAKWTLYDLQDKLSQQGWMVPAYTLPSKLEDYVVMRVVVRQGFSRDMADMLLGDIKNAIVELEKLDYPTPTRMAQDKNLPVESKIFNHGGRHHKK